MTQSAIDRIVGALPKGASRVLVAIAGPPGSGKSTISDALVKAVPDSALVPMDGFHLDNAVLDQRGLRSRKGAPETFDLSGLRTLIGRLKTGEEVVIPRFDRARDLAVAGAAVVPPEASVVFVEGNYLLFDEPGWRDLAELWDLGVFLPVDEGELERRLVQRWLDHGLDQARARERALGNDIPNARRVMAARMPADVTV